MMQHMSSMQFFDESAVPNRLAYISGYATLASGNLRDVLKLISREINIRKTTLLVIDGLGIVTSSHGPAKMKEFVHELQTLTQAYGCTSVLLTDGMQAAYHPENTMVDGLVALYRTMHGTRSVREIEVLKLRGSLAIFGRHSFMIGDEGLLVFPRLEAIAGKAVSSGPSTGQRAVTGVPALDNMIGGGLPRGTTTMLLGPSGCGKTTLGLQFIANSTHAEPGLLFSFYETGQGLINKAKSLNMGLPGLVESGAVEIIYTSPPEQILDNLGACILDAVRKRNVKRLFIDGLDGFQATTPDPDRVLPFFTAMCNELRHLGVTTLYSAETRVVTGLHVETPISGVSLITDNLILLRYLELRTKLFRLLSILKIRDSDFDHSLRQYRISAKGFDLDESFENAEAMLLAGSTDKLPGGNAPSNLG